LVCPSIGRFLPEEQELYNALDAASKQMFHQLEEAGKAVRCARRRHKNTRSSANWLTHVIVGGKYSILVGQATNLTHVLVVLTRLRQLCDHQALCLPEQLTDAALQNPLEVLLSAPGANPTSPASAGAGAATPIKPEEKATNGEVRCVARARACWQLC